MFARRRSMFTLALLAIAIALPLPAAAIFFTPGGSQVDSDPILDAPRDAPPGHNQGT